MSTRVAGGRVGDQLAALALMEDALELLDRTDRQLPAAHLSMAIETLRSGGSPHRLPAAGEGRLADALLAATWAR